VEKPAWVTPSDGKELMDAEDEPLPNLIGLAGTNTDSSGDLALRHDECLIQDKAEQTDEYMAIEQRRLVAAWEAYSRDTAQDIDRRRLAAAWNAPSWRKLWMAAEMSQAALSLTVAGLKRRYPEANEQEIRFRLALLLFDPQIAHDLCGREPEDHHDIA
jgi:hypothetical protein